jgi:hypothetical protein
MKNKILLVDEETRARLWAIKLENRLKSHNEAIQLLIKNYENQTRN